MFSFSCKKINDWEREREALVVVRRLRMRDSAAYFGFSNVESQSVSQSTCERVRWSDANYHHFQLVSSSLLSTYILYSLSFSPFCMISFGVGTGTLHIRIWHIGKRTLTTMMRRRRGLSRKDGKEIIYRARTVLQYFFFKRGREVVVANGRSTNEDEGIWKQQKRRRKERDEKTWTTS